MYSPQRSSFQLSHGGLVGLRAAEYLRHQRVHLGYAVLGVDLQYARVGLVSVDGFWLEAKGYVFGLEAPHPPDDVGLHDGHGAVGHEAEQLVPLARAVPPDQGRAGVGTLPAEVHAQGAVGRGDAHLKDLALLLVVVVVVVLVVVVGPGGVGQLAVHL